MSVIENFRVTLDFQVTVDESTGEIITQCVKKSIDKTGFKATTAKTTRSSKSKKEESSEPTLILEDNKYSLNQAAVDLMEVAPDDKLDIKYEKQGKNLIPVIGNDENFGTHNGNRLTKSHTVAFRGSKNQELAKFGTEFLIIPHESKVGIFILKNKDAKLEESIEKDEDIELPIDFDLQEIIDNGDATEVEASIFQL